MAGVKGMHERQSTSPTYAAKVRARIRAGGIVHRLERHVLGQIEMSATQVSAALGLLRKCVPDLSNVEHTGKDGGPIKVEEVSNVEAARAIAFAMAEAAQAVKKARDSSKESA
jgi:hypothetical protein